VLRGGEYVRINKALYGYRKAPKLWQGHLTALLIELKLTRSKVEPTIFFSTNGKLVIMVHVDDLLIGGTSTSVMQLFVGLQRKVKLREVGRLENAGDRAEYLSRTIQMTEKGFHVRGSVVMVELLLKDLGIEQQGCKYTPTPSVKYTATQQMKARDLEGTEIRKFRSILGKALFISHDRFDVQYACKEIARGTKAPTEIHEWGLKRLGKYLAHHKEMAIIYEATEKPSVIKIGVDSDWAGEVQTRRSTSGGAVSVAGCMEASWSRSQGPVALSSGEAEYRAMIVGIQEGRQVQSFLEELGYPTQLEAWTDSNAAKQSAEKVGTLHMKHLQLKELFVKDMIVAGLLKVHKERTSENPVDCLTKSVPGDILRRCILSTKFWQVFLEDEK